jgi:hypothetical protein
MLDRDISPPVLLDEQGATPATEATDPTKNCRSVSCDGTSGSRHVNAEGLIFWYGATGVMAKLLDVRTVSVVLYGSKGVSRLFADKGTCDFRLDAGDTNGDVMVAVTALFGGCGGAGALVALGFAADKTISPVDE